MRISREALIKMLFQEIINYLKIKDYDRIDDVFKLMEEEYERVYRGSDLTDGYHINSMSLYNFSPSNFS